jgi:hypothetical protein
MREHDFEHCQHFEVLWSVTYLAINDVAEDNYLLGNVGKGRYEHLGTAEGELTVEVATRRQLAKRTAIWQWELDGYRFCVLRQILDNLQYNLN